MSLQVTIIRWFCSCLQLPVPVPSIHCASSCMHSHASHSLPCQASDPGLVFPGERLYLRSCCRPVLRSCCLHRSQLQGQQMQVAWLWVFSVWELAAPHEQLHL